MPASSLSRRTLIGGALAAALPASAAAERIELINAPSNLGLRPLRPGHVPGAWRAPAALQAAGVVDALRPSRVVELARPAYRLEAERGTRIRNGHAIRSFSEELARAVVSSLDRGSFPVVVGGDCSILLGGLLGAKRHRQCGLVHVDGHSDFYHPGNYDSAARLGSVAGMDLALATGRGEPLLARWDGAVLVEDAFAVQIGERDELDPVYDFADIARTAIRRIPVRQALAIGMRRTVERALAPVAGKRRPMWLHIDLDVLDGRIMPAVDSPGSPGLSFEQLSLLTALIRKSGRLLGMDMAIYDPDLDPTGRFARGIVACLKAGLYGTASS